MLTILHGLVMKQVYKITYPTGKIYVGKDSIGSYRYYGSPDMHLVNEDFATLPESVRKDYTIRKQILWESADCSEAELSTKEVEFIRSFQSNDPDIGYNRWPKLISKKTYDAGQQHSVDEPPDTST